MFQFHEGKSVNEKDVLLTIDRHRGTFGFEKSLAMHMIKRQYLLIVLNALLIVLLKVLMAHFSATVKQVCECKLGCHGVE